MRFTEIDVFGVYIAPMSLMMVAAWLVTIALRRVASRFGLSQIAPAASGWKENIVALSEVANRWLNERVVSVLVSMRVRPSQPMTEGHNGHNEQETAGTS